MNCARLRILRAGLAALALFALAAPAAATGTITTLGSGSVFIPFGAGSTNSAGQLVGSPTLPVGLNGGAVSNFVMDVGSQGIVVTPDVFNPVGLTPIGTSSQTYVSDGRIYSGNVYQLPVQIGGSGAYATTNIPVLVADTLTCTSNATNCVASAPGTTPTGWSFVGISFGQEAEQQTFGTPAVNPLRNVTGVNGQAANVSAGYIITAGGISVGLTALNTSPFTSSSLATLTWSATLGDWIRAPMTVSANGLSNGGTFLPDSGIRFAYLQTDTALYASLTCTNNNGDSGTCATLGTSPPSSFNNSNPACPAGVVCLAGMTVNVAVGNAGAPAITLSITADGTGAVGSGPPGSPAFVNVIAADQAGIAYWNTGFSFYNNYHYLFDATDGIVGYIPATQEALNLIVLPSTSVPEPMSVGLFAMGLMGLLAVSRRRAER